MLWLREIHKALIVHIKDLMLNAIDCYGNPIKPNVFTRSPNMDLTTESYPCISIFNVDFDESITFSDVNSYEIIDNLNGTKTKKSVPPNFLFKFQIDFWTKSRLEMDGLLLNWVTNTPRYSTINIADSTGEYEYSCYFTTRTPVNLDSLSAQEETLYRTMIPCEILVPIDNSVSSSNSYKTVEGINYNTNTK